LIAVNFTNAAREVALSFENSSDRTIQNPLLFLTDEFSKLAKQDINLQSGNLVVPARSVVTYTAGLKTNTSGSAKIEKSDFNAFLDSQKEEIVAIFGSGQIIHTVRLFNVTGNLLEIKSVENGQTKVVFPASHLPDGVYLVSGEGINLKETKKIVVTKR